MKPIDPDIIVYEDNTNKKKLGLEEDEEWWKHSMESLINPSKKEKPCKSIVGGGYSTEVDYIDD